MVAKNTLFYPFPTVPEQYSPVFDSVQIFNGTTFADETVDSTSVTSGDVTLGSVVNSAYYFGDTADAHWSGFRGSLSIAGLTQSFTSVKTFNGTTWVTETTDANSTGSNDISLTSNVGHKWFFGCANLFEGLRVQKNTSFSYLGSVLKWEYSTGGNTWVEFAPSISFGVDTHLNNNDPTGITNCQMNELCWDSSALSGWTTDTQDGVSAYYIRVTIITPYVNVSGTLVTTVTFTRFQAINGKWQYWNGASWVFFAPKTTDIFSANYTASSGFFLATSLYFSFNPFALTGWANTSGVNSPNLVNGRYIRYLITSDFVTVPIGSYFTHGFYNYLNKTIYCSEVNARTITSAWLRATAIINDDSTDYKGGAVYVRVNGGSWSEYVDQLVYADTGESFTTFIGTDITSQLNSNFTGSSTTIEIATIINCDFEATTTSYISNSQVELGFTYEFNEVGQNILTKTVKYPLPTPINYFTTSYQTIDTLPAWDTFLPEVNKNIRNIVIVMEGSSQCNVATAHTFKYRFDAGADNVFGDVTNPASSEYNVFAAIDLSALATNATHLFEGSSTNSGAKYNPIAFTVYVTYDYDISLSTRVLNSIVSSYDPYLDHMFPTGIAIIIKLNKIIRIAEPGTITIKQSAVRSLFNENASLKFRCKVGAGSVRDYQGSAITINGSSQIFNTVFSSVEVPLVRGANNITTEIDTGGTGSIAFYAKGSNHEIILNYESDIAPSGVNNHNKTIYKYFSGYSEGVAAASTRTILLEFATIVESTFFINEAAFEIKTKSSTSNEVGAIGIFSVSGDDVGSGYHISNTYALANFQERGIKCSVCSILNAFKQYPEQPPLSNPSSYSQRFDIELKRRFTFFNSYSPYRDIWSRYTYHSISKVLTGTITGFSGDGSGITVNIYCVSNGNQLVATVTTSIGGTFSFTCYDETEVLFATAERDDGIIISSQKEANSTSYDISFNSGSSVTSYAFIG